MNSGVDLALGTPVVYWECAGVARKGNGSMWNKGWCLPQKGNGFVPGYGIKQGENGEWATDPVLLPKATHAISFVGKDGERLTDEAIGKINKAVVTWAQEGSGVVCGLETKMVGVSVSPGGGTNLFGEGEWEPGYFEHRDQLKLYVVRHRLEGREFVYVPPWAIKPVVHSAA